MKNCLSLAPGFSPVNQQAIDERAASAAFDVPEAVKTAFLPPPDLHTGLKPGANEILPSRRHSACHRVLPMCLAVLVGLVFTTNFARCQEEITITHQVPVIGSTKPIPVSLEGFTGEVLDALKFDLYVQGFSFVAPAAAQYQISGGNNGNVSGRVVDLISKQTKLAHSYSGATPRRQAHAFADDIVEAITGRKGIAQTKIAFKVAAGGNGEIYVADFDGHNAQAVTHDNTIVAAPAWVPGRLALYYTSYARGNPDIYYHNLGTGQRRVIAGYSGLNTSAAVSPDGSKLAMILSRGGSPDVWVCNADGTNLRQMTATDEDESSPCWSPNGQLICFARKNRRTPRAGQGAGRRRPADARPNARRAESHRAGLVAGRQMDCVHFADGRFQHLRDAGGRRHARRARAWRRSVMGAQFADADFRAAHRRPLCIICA